MLGKPSITVGRKIGFIISIAVLLTQTTGCQSEEGDSKMMDTEKVDIGVDTDNTSPAIIRVVNLSGNVMFADVPAAAKGTHLQGTGTVGSTGTNTHIIKLKSGKLFVHIAKFEQLREVSNLI